MADKQDSVTPKAQGHQVGKRYELAIADLLQIPEDRFDDFLIDLKKWHGAVRATLNLLDTIAEAVGEKPSTLAKMVWIDDGKHDGKLIFTAKTDDAVTDLAKTDLADSTDAANPPKQSSKKSGD